MIDRFVSRSLLRVGLPIAIIASSAMIAHAYDTTWIAPGQTLSAAKLKADLDEVQGGLAVLQGQITTPSLETREPSAFHASLTTASSITGAPTIVFDHVDFDVAGEYNNVSGAFVAKHAGIYLVTCNLFFTVGGTPTTFGIMLSKNSTSITIVDTQSSTSNYDAGGIAPAATATVQLAAGDSVTCSGGDESGTTRRLDTNEVARNTFSVTRLY